MTTGSDVQIHIRPYTANDAPGVREVLEATYGAKATPAAVYDWWSLGYAPEAHGFMVAESGGRIVGVQPMELFPYSDGDLALRGGMLTGVAVHPEFQRRGIFMELVQACEAAAWRQGAAFVTTMPNERSRPGFIKMGYVDLGRRRLLMRLLRPGTLGGLKVPVAGHLGGWMAGGLQEIWARTEASPGIRVREVAAPDPGWERLFQGQAARHPGLALSRSGRWLQWRYAMAPPGRQYRCFEAMAKGGDLIGAVVTTQEVRDGVTMAYVMDLAVERPGLTGALMGPVLAALSAGGAHAVTAVVSSPALVEILRSAGFWEVPAWAPLKRFYSVVRFNPDQAVPERWTAIQGWHQSLGDWDNL